MALNLEKTFAVLKPDQSVELAAVSPGLYAELDEKFDNFKSHVLVSLHAFDSDWGVWEKHPAGDEIVLLLSGSAKMTIRTNTGEETHTLTSPGSFVIVPKNMWHTAHIAEPTHLLFITPGEGTENSPAPQAEPC